MKHFLSVAALFSVTACASAPEVAHAQLTMCRPAGHDRAQLDTLKANSWTIENDAARNALALGLAECLGDPDSAVRDGIAFEALQHYMRNDLLTRETLAALNANLQAKLIAPDPRGFQRPFAALVLADVARTDRVAPWMSEAQRMQLIDAAIAYMRGINDYRGFTPGEGYRHATAHTADLMLQLVLNPAVGKPDLIRIRDAIATQIAPADHSYIHGESERLATPIIYMATRNVFDEAEWTAWFAQISGPGPLGASWDGWWQSEQGLARRHNLMTFLNVMQTNVSLSQNPAFAPMRPGVEAAVRSLP
ncbi:MAG: DUF2785 domain-containing protein [Hyphomonadaceae bacterium]